MTWTIEDANRELLRLTPEAGWHGRAVLGGILRSGELP